MAFKMKGKSPMMKALIGKQHNLPPELKAKIEASPAKKYASDAQRKAVHASKAESGMKMKKEAAMKLKITQTPEGGYGKKHDKLTAKGRKAQDDAMDAFDAGKTRKTDRLDKKAAKKFGKARDIRVKSPMKLDKNKPVYDKRVETKKEVMKANALEDKNNDAAARKAYAKMMAKKAKKETKAKDTPMKKSIPEKMQHGGVSGEKGSKERRLKKTRAKLINKQHAKKKGTIGNAIRKSRVKNINRKLKADGTFYADKDQGTKSVRDGGRIEF